MCHPNVGGVPPKKGSVSPRNDDVAPGKDIVPTKIGMGYHKKES